MGKLIMRTKNLFLTSILILVLVSLTPVEAVQLQPGERLEYTFSYRGIFSGFVEMDIAHAEFAVQPVADSIAGSETYLTTLDLTTEPYGKAEMLYPVRYHYRSWLEPDQQVPLLVTEYLETDEIREELLWFDRANRLGYHYVKRDTPVAADSHPPDFLLEKLGVSPDERSLMQCENQQALADDRVWDYLSLIYRLRYLELETGKAIDLPLYNGKQIKHYRVEVSRERLRRAGWDRPTFKLSLYELRKGKSKKNLRTSVWISDDEHRLPLRFHAERAFGALEGTLQTGRPLVSGEEDFSVVTRSSLELVF